MIHKRIFGTLTAIVALSAAAVLYTAHSVRSSDHQDTYNLANSVGHNPSADITDVFVFPDPADNTRVVFAMNVWPLIPPGMGATKLFDPSLMWQFKIAHGAATNPEDEVIQFGATGATTGQTITLYGPAKPNQVGTTNTFVPTSGSFSYNNATTLTVNGNQIQVFAGPRADAFVFDLFAFFTFLGDRNVGTHASQSDPGYQNNLYNGNNQGVPAAYAPGYDKVPSRATTPSFNGFSNTTVSNVPGYTSPLGNYACSANPAQNVLSGFNVLSFVIEVPKSMLTTGYPSQQIHTWATVSSSKTNS